jgi:plasmid stabilization system protein ParE
MKLEWSATALADLDRFATFLHDRHPRLAKIIAAEIKHKARILSEHPLIGRAIEGRLNIGSLCLMLRTRNTFSATRSMASVSSCCVFSIAASSGSD